MNRQWLEEIDKNILYFTPFYEEVRLAELFHDEDDKNWYYSSDLLNVSNEYLDSDSLEEARKEVEDLIEIYFEDAIEYYKYMLCEFKISRM